MSSGKRKIKNRNRPWKLGRNDPCSCGSGLKFKKCCLPKVISPTAPPIMASKDGKAWKEAPPELREKAMRAFEEKERKEQERVARFGQIRPQISVVHQGQRMVTVRNRIYYSDKWKYFPDFLRDYVPQVL